MSQIRKTQQIILALLTLCSTHAAMPAYERMWDNDVLPVLDRYCFKCHAGVRQKSGLDLRSLDTILRGGERGPAVIPGKPEESRLLSFLAPEADPHMPPERKKQVSPAEINLLRQWISKLPTLSSSCATNSASVDSYLSDLRKSEKPSEAPPDATSPNEAIDSILAADWNEENITPAPLSDDRTFVRRIYLDLAGRTPTQHEAESFLSSQEPDRRTSLVDALLESADYPKRMRDVFDVVLLGRPKGRAETARRDHGWFSYLEESFRTNRPWNETVTEIILARATNSPVRGAAQFLYERRNNHQAMAEAVAPIAFGMQIGCAQCHNHPLSWEIEQRHYWGLVAAFNRSKNVDLSSGVALSESAIGGFVQFTNLKKESQAAVLAFLNGKIVDEKRPAADEKEKDDPELYIIPPAKEGAKTDSPTIPKFSRRKALAEAVTHDNPRLAKAFVNRIWQILMGRGIVHPVDQMDSRHRPSHPLLLDWLASDFERHNYDVKRLVRAIVTSRAYQLDSKGSDHLQPSSFARALDKPLSAEQLTASLLVATGNFPAGEEREKELRRAIAQKFPDFMPAVYNPSLDQALFWSNSPVIDSLLKPENGNTAAQLLAVASPADRVRKAFRLVLGREPADEELEQLKALGIPDATEKGVKNLLWALLSSAEFQLNH